MTGGVLVCASCGGTWSAPPVKSCPYCGARDDDELDDDALELDLDDVRRRSPEPVPQRRRRRRR